MLFRMGIDIGSTTAKVVVLDMMGEMIFSDYRRHNAETVVTLKNVLGEARRLLGDVRVDLQVTGSAGLGVSEKFGFPFIQEVIASAEIVKQRYPELNVYINGGIRKPDDINTHLQHVDGVMIGREAYHNPWLLAELETCFDGVPALRSRHEVVRDMLPYIDDEIMQGVKLQQISRHMLGLFQSQPGARAWRRYISEHAHLSGAGVEVLASVVDPRTEEERPVFVRQQRILATSFHPELTDDTRIHELLMEVD